MGWHCSVIFDQTKKSNPHFNIYLKFPFCQTALNVENMFAQACLIAFGIYSTYKVTFPHLVNRNQGLQCSIFRILSHLL